MSENTVKKPEYITSEKQQTLTFEKLEPLHLGHFFFNYQMIDASLCIFSLYQHIGSQYSRIAFFWLISKERNNSIDFIAQN